MSSLRRVAGDRAGPAALGILVPPGRRTFVILRPRALSWDLLLLRDRAGEAPPAFRDVGRHEATQLAQVLYRALQDWIAGGPEKVAVVQLVGGGHGVGVELGGLPLLACPREPGQAYQPLIFERVQEAQAAAAVLTPVLFPATGSEQEVYFNTQHFTR